MKKETNKDEKPMKSLHQIFIEHGVTVDGLLCDAEDIDRIETACKEYTKQEVAKVRAEYSERSLLNEENAIKLFEVANNKCGN